MGVVDNCSTYTLFLVTLAIKSNDWLIISSRPEMNKSWLPGNLLVPLEIFLILLIAACGGGSASNPPPPSFTIEASPGSISVSQGSVSSPVKLTVVPANGFSGAVSVTATGLPSGLTSDPPLPISIGAANGNTSSITLSAAAGAQTGSSTVAFTGSSGSLTSQAQLQLQVQAAQNPEPLRLGLIRIGSTPRAFELDDPQHRTVLLDSARGHVFVANGVLNQVGVYSTADGSQVAAISVPSPSSLDVSPDGSRIWVGTDVEEIDAIDPVALQIVARLPVPGVTSQGVGGPLFSIPTGVVLTGQNQALVHLHWRGTTGSEVVEWDLGKNIFTSIPSSPFNPGAGFMARSGDYSKVLVGSIDTSGIVAIYDTASGSFTSHVQLFSTIPTVLAANTNGSQFAVFFDGQGGPSTLEILDAGLNTLATLPTVQVRGMLYSLDGKSLYVADQLNGSQVVKVIDAQSFAVTGVVPDHGVPNLFGGTELEDLDSTNLIYGAGNHGIAIVDGAKPLAVLPVFPSFNAMVPFSTPQQGPASASTKITISGVNFATPAQVFFGNRPGTVSSTTGSSISASSPGVSVAGPVNVTAFFPNGWGLLAPDAFTYGPEVLTLNANAGPSAGGQQINVFGFGFGTDMTQLSVKLGANSATVTQLLSTQQTLQNPFISPFTEPPLYPLQEATIAVPPGSPGLADLSLTTPAGTFVLPAAFHYVSKATVFANASASSLSFITYDQKRQRLYITAKDHVEIFNLTTNQFGSPIAMPGGPFPNSDLRDVKLTIDGSKMIVADYGRSALYLIDPDMPANSTAVSVPPATNLPSGPTQLAATSKGLVFVGLSFQGSGGCPCLDQLNLTTNAVSNVPLEIR
jgi:IPT/TIG domain